MNPNVGVGPWTPPGRMETALDMAERLVLLLLYGQLVWRLWPTLGDQPANGLLILAETIVVGFVVCRRATQAITKNPFDWLLALAGTLPPLMLRAGGGHGVLPSLAAGAMVAGIIVQVSAKFSLRRSFGIAAANRGVKVGGPYLLVRHPMYLGYAITWIGFVLVNPLGMNFALVGFAGTMQIARVIVEERLLRGDPAYRAYMERVRFRILPGVF